MGSGSPSRKATDAPKISVRKQKSNSKGSGAGSSSPGRPSNEYCPQSFKVPLPAQPKLVEGMRLTLKKIGQALAVYYGSTRITDLKPKFGQQIERCMSDGFGYSGTVRSGQGGSYGEFQRSS